MGLSEIPLQELAIMGGCFAVVVRVAMDYAIIRQARETMLSKIEFEQRMGELADDFVTRREWEESRKGKR